MEEMYAALHMCTCAEKTTFLGRYDITIVEWGEDIMVLGAMIPNHILVGRSFYPYPSYIAAHSSLRHF